MSFIVKGIDLPKDGESIRLVITSSGNVVEVWRDGLAKAYHPNKAIQIPKDHGRIGDLDRLKKEIKENDIMGGLNYKRYIDNAPTILEGEER